MLSYIWPIFSTITSKYLLSLNIQTSCTCKILGIYVSDNVVFKISLSFEACLFFLKKINDNQVDDPTWEQSPHCKVERRLSQILASLALEMLTQSEICITSVEVCKSRNHIAYLMRYIYSFPGLRGNLKLASDTLGRAQSLGFSTSADAMKIYLELRNIHQTKKQSSIFHNLSELFRSDTSNKKWKNIVVLKSL